MKRIKRELELDWEVISKMNVNELIEVSKSLEAESRDLYSMMANLRVQLDPLERRQFRLLDEQQSISHRLYLKFGATNRGTEERGDLTISKEEKIKASKYYYRNLKGRKDETASE